MKTTQHRWFFSSFKARGSELGADDGPATFHLGMNTETAVSVSVQKSYPGQPIIRFGFGLNSPKSTLRKEPNSVEVRQVEMARLISDATGQLRGLVFPLDGDSAGVPVNLDEFLAGTDKPRMTNTIAVRLVDPEIEFRCKVSLLAYGISFTYSDGIENALWLADLTKRLNFDATETAEFLEALPTIAKEDLKGSDWLAIKKDLNGETNDLFLEIIAAFDSTP